MAAAIEILDGFEDYPDVFSAGVGLLANWWGSNSFGNNELLIAPGRVGGQAIEFRGSVFIAAPITDSTQASGFFSTRRIENNTSSFMALTNGSGYTQHIRLSFDADGTLFVHGPDNTVLGVVHFALPLNTWASIAWCAKIHDSLGEFKLWINGEPKLTIANVDTRNAADASGTINRIRFLSSAALGNLSFQVDDVRVDSDSFYQIPEGRFASVYVNETIDADFTPNGAATNHEAVDDPTCDMDVTYNESNTVGHVDRFGLAELGFNPDVIYAVQMTLISRKVDVATRRLNAFLEVGAEVITTPDKFETTDYTIQRLISVTNPNTTLPYTKGDLAAARLGYELIE